MTADISDAVEAVEGWAPKSDKRRPDEGLLQPGHPELPPASDLLETEKLELLSPCGEENRVRQPQTKTWPWSAICYLIIRRGRKYYRGTGFFIAPDAVVTAGHCLHNRTGYADSVQVVPGRDGEDWPFGSVLSRDFHVPTEWRRGRDAAFDYGVLRLPDGDLGGRAGVLPVAALETEVLKTSELNTAGYPSDIEPSTAMHFNAGPCDAVYAQRLQYFVDTWKGASGSPVWIKSGETRTVVGIHNYGHCPNFATRINARVLQDLKAWAAG